MDRYICIHAHFYQPPRENPWLEVIERQPAAYPYHDWNQRITAECYAPNTGSRILDAEGRITRIVNNYSRISFNFGPTLLSWMEENEPEVYAAILEADRESQQRFSGHGSALAQAYNHMILPLANTADRCTQILWGLRDFEHRFKRQPEGIWLPEAAVDLETLELLAEFGIRFTVLSPYQAQRTRKMGGRWRDATGGILDPTLAYEQALPSGRSLAVFFYDGPISRAVAFERLLARGEHLAGRLLGAFANGGERPELVHIATDGETYGHHHRHGDMALAYALHHIDSNGLAKLTNYGEYLERYPPAHQVEIKEQTAWSCSHGVGRWWTDCGCNTGRHPNWNQAWRTPLRNALDWLRDTLAPAYEEKGRLYLKDPWAARDDYIKVVLDRAPEKTGEFLAAHASRELNQDERVAVLKLLELQRNAMLMYTSCGWFFDELSGIETVQILQYAGRAIQLAEEVGSSHVEPTFVAKLAEAKSNSAEYGDGALIYEREVKPAMVRLEQVGAHYAIRSLFETDEKRASVYCYSVREEHRQVLEAGKARLAVGRAAFTSEITQESALLSYAVLHFGDHSLKAGVRRFQGEAAYQKLLQDVGGPFERADFPEILGQLDRHFGESTYSLQSLFGDEQSKIVNLILESTLEQAAAAHQQVYDYFAPLMRYLTGLGVALPGVLRMTSEFVVNNNLRRALEDEELDLQHIRALLAAAAREKVTLDTAGLGYALGRAVEKLLAAFRQTPHDLGLLRKLEEASSLVKSLPFEVQLWRVQNLYWEILQGVYPEYRSRADEEAQTWLKHFVSLGGKLSVYVPNS